MIENRKYYPLSYPQKKIWNKTKLQPNCAVNTISGTIFSSNDLNSKLLESSINHVIKQHCGLRLRIIAEGGEVKQYISEYKPCKIELLDFTGRNGETKQKEWLLVNNQTPFDLIDSDLFRFGIIKNHEQKVGVYIKTHQLISDGVTFGLISRKIFEYYSQVQSEHDIKTLNGSTYIDYLFYESEYKKSQKFENDQKYWLTEFGTIPQQIKSKMGAIFDYSAKALIKKIPPAKVANIRKFLNNCQIFQFFLSILFICLAKTSLKNDLVIGYIDRGRYGFPIHIMETAGMFGLTLLFRMKVDPGKKFSDFFNEIIKKKRQINLHKKYPFDLLIETLKEKHSSITGNIIEVVLSYEEENFDYSKNSDDEISINWQFNGAVATPLVLHIMNEKDGSMTLRFVYQKYYFSSEEIFSLYRNILHLIDNVIEKPEMQIIKYDLLT